MGQHEHHQHDYNMKALVDSNPEAVARFVLHQWYKHKRIEMPEVKITKVTQLSAEFEAKKLEGDGVLLVEGPEGPFSMLEVEFQSKLHPYMPLRSLVYLAKAKEKHWKVYDHLPVLAAVIYLYDSKDVPEFLEHWSAPYEQTSMNFYYLPIYMKNLSREEVLALGESALWPLALLTAEPVDRIIVKTMFEELLEHQLYKTLPIAYAIATVLLRSDDLDWLQKEYRKMLDFFEDAPSWQWMAEDITQKLKPELEAQLKAEYEAKYEQKMLEERKQMLKEQRQNVVQLVSLRFPTLKSLAKTQMRRIKEPAPLQQAMLLLSLAHDSNEAEKVLSSLSEKEEDKNE